MTLSRSPSTRPGGGWSSPGLTSPHASLSGRSSPAVHVGDGSNSVTWESAKAKSNGINGYPSFSTQNKGFFNRHYRSISNSLPRFNLGTEKSYAEKEKLGRGRWVGAEKKLARVGAVLKRVNRKTKIRVLLVLSLILLYILFYATRKLKHFLSEPKEAEPLREFGPGLCFEPRRAGGVPLDRPDSLRRLAWWSLAGR